MKRPRLPRWMWWDHTMHYHPFVLSHVPAACKSALDVGCGAGQFAVALAERSTQVVGLDRDGPILEVARVKSAHPRVRYVQGDLLTCELPSSSFDFVSCLAAIHHMPFEAALVRMADLLAPGGKLVVVGFFRLRSPFDYAQAVLTALLDVFTGPVRHRRDRRRWVAAAPIKPWSMSMREIRSAAKGNFPEAKVRRHLYRYSLLLQREG